MSVEVRSLSFSYGQRQVLRDISFTAAEGELLSVLGPNGVGKSTLFRCMLGLLRGCEGQVLINGRDTRGLSPREMASLVAYIPQNSVSAFNHSVLDIVLMGAAGSLGPFSAPKKSDYDRAMRALEKTGIAPLASRCFHRISGGERQLVMLARALVQDAPVLMLDEPTASLDLRNRMAVLDQIRTLAAEGYTVIQTTHSPEQSYQYSHRILALRDGAVLRCGTPREVLTRETMQTLYGPGIEVLSLCGDRARVCLPASVSSYERSKP